MTDNTPRPEPMSRESVLAVLDHFTPEFSATVSALYDNLDEARKLMDHRDKLLLAVCAERDSLKRTLLGVRELLLATRSGTEPSDAEGG